MYGSFWLCGIIIGYIIGDSNASNWDWILRAVQSLIGIIIGGGIGIGLLGDFDNYLRRNQK
ncbi:MAG: hypothetical protein ACK5MK_00380 [Dysgonomonas sp.]